MNIRTAQQIRASFATMSGDELRRNAARQKISLQQLAEAITAVQHEVAPLDFYDNGAASASLAAMLEVVLNASLKC